MEKNKKLLTFERLFFAGFIILVVAYLVYDRSKDPGEVEQATESEMKVTNYESNTKLNDSIVDFGMELLGTPYVAAGCSRDGFDCSGFVNFVFGNFNIDVPRSSADFEHFGKEIPVEKVRKGDLLLFLSPTRNVIGHIGIVSDAKGKESDFIHASSGHEMKVIISSLGSKGYTERFVKAIRVL